MVQNRIFWAEYWHLVPSSVRMKGPSWHQYQSTSYKTGMESDPVYQGTKKIKRTSWLSCLMAGNGAGWDFLGGILAFCTQLCIGEGTVLARIQIKILQK